MRMNKDIKRRWVEALRSGTYTQGRRALRVRVHQKMDDEFCCLGVLCELAVADGVIPPPVEAGLFVRYGDDSGFSQSTLPPAVQRWAGLDHSDPRVGDRVAIARRGGTIRKTLGETTLATLNDGGSTFEQIATIIEEDL